MKKYYTVQSFSNNIWNSFLSATAVNLSYATGFVRGIKQFYPCPDLKIIDHNTNEVIKEIKGNGEVVVNEN